MELFDLIQTLVKAHGPSGDEGEIRALIARLAAPWADEVTTDTLGNLIVRKKGPGPKVMFAAHMDSIGLVVTHIQEDGFLRVGRLGGVSPKEAAYTPVRFQNGAGGTCPRGEGRLRQAEAGRVLCGHRSQGPRGGPAAGPGGGHCGLQLPLLYERR